MRDVDIPLGSARALVERIRSGAIDPATVAAAVRAQAERAVHLNAFVGPTLTELEERARAATEGLLQGLPVAVKDCFDVAGLATSGGTPALSSRVARADAPVIARLRAAGAWIVGKNTMHELSFGITTNNAFSGPARNPVDPSLIPGGSSGGTGVAVAAGVVPVGLGADTGGSVRLPASLCGVVGFRPTLGRYPSGGAVPISHSRDTAGLLAHSVTDVRLVDAVLVAADPAAGAPGRVAAAPTLVGVRLGAPTRFWRDLDPDVESVCRAALDALRSAGAQLVELDADAVIDQADQIGLPLCLHEFLPDLAGYLAATGGGIEVADVAAQVASPDVRAIVEMARSGERHPGGAAAYAQLLERLATLRREYAALLSGAGVAALVFPTAPLPARPIGQDRTTTLAGRVVPTFPTYLRHTNLAGVAGHPGISLPVGHTPEGLPVGLELDGALGADEALLELAEAVEATCRRSGVAGRG